MKSPWTIPLAIIFGGALIAWALYSSIPHTAVTNKTVLVRPVSTTDHILGNPVARIVVVTYTDFECTHCKDFHEAMNQIIAQAGTTGEVAWVLRHFPLTEIDPNAFSHARATECAAQTGGNETFWKFADALFSAQPVTPQAYGVVASAAGIRGTAFATCVSSTDPAIDARINADRENALAIGADGTPYSVILVNGSPVDVMQGAYSYAAINALLKKLKP